MIHEVIEMSRCMKLLTPAIHLHTAMMDQLQVVVFIGELMGAGQIVEITETKRQNRGRVGTCAKYVRLFKYTS